MTDQKLSDLRMGLLSVFLMTAALLALVYYSHDLEVWIDTAKAAVWALVTR